MQNTSTGTSGWAAVSSATASADFLNAAASSAVADFWFFGRGRRNDQPSAFSASQPRWGRTRSSPRWAGHHVCHLAARPQAAVGRRLDQPQPHHLQHRPCQEARLEAIMPPLIRNIELVQCSILSTLKTRAGTPPTNDPVCTSFVTTAPAAITELFPMVTPAITSEFAPIHTLSPIVIGFAIQSLIFPVKFNE